MNKVLKKTTLTSNTLNEKDIEKRKEQLQNTIGFMRVAGHEIPEDMKPIWETWVRGEISDQELDEKIMQDVSTIAGKKVSI